MAETGIDTIMGYGGNAALGLGGNSDVPAIGTVNNSVIDSAVQNVMLLNAQQNKEIFQQKVQDRNVLLQMMGKPVNGDETMKGWKIYQEKNNDYISFDEFLKKGVADGTFTYRLVGDDGTTNESINKSALMIISNKATKKGQQGVFEPDGQEGGGSQESTQYESSQKY